MHHNIKQAGLEVPQIQLRIHEIGIHCRKRIVIPEEETNKFVGQPIGNLIYLIKSQEKRRPDPGELYRFVQLV